LAALFSLTTGAWTASSGGISPARWLACIALPVVLASRGLQRGVLTLSGAVATTQVGFLFCLARLGLLFILAAHLELSTPRSRMPFQRHGRIQPKTFCRVWLECSIACSATSMFLSEVGVAADGWLDFRTSFNATWLSLTVLASFSVDGQALRDGSSLAQSILISARRGALMSASYVFGAFLASAPLAPVSPAVVSPPSQIALMAVGAIGGILGAIAAPLLRQVIGHNGDSNADLPILPLANGMAAILLPRTALTLDAYGSTLWNAVGRLSSQ